MFCFFHNCMWQSWYSEVNVVLLHLYGSLRSGLIFFNFCRCRTRNFLWILNYIRVSPFLLSAWRPRDQTRYLSRFPLWTLAHLRVSPFLIIGFLVLVGFVGYLCCFQRLLNPIHSSIIFVGNLRWWSRWHIYLLVYDFFRFHHNYFRDTINKLGVYRKGWLRYILFDRTSINPFRWASCISTQYTVSWCLYHFFCLYDARCGLVKSSSCGSLWSLFMRFTAVKNTVCHSLLEFRPPAINPEFVMECKLTAHAIWQMNSKTLSGINTLSWSAWTMGLRPEWPWRLGDKGFLVLMDQYNIEIFSCFLRLLPLCSSTFHQTNIENSQICSEDNLSISRVRSPYLLLEVLRVEAECSFFLPLGKLDRVELLIQYQSMFFQE